MLNVRLDKEMEKKLKMYSVEHDMPKSQVVKEALAKYFTKEELSSSPFAIGEDLFGAVGSGKIDNSSTYKSKLKSKLIEKYTH